MTPMDSVATFNNLTSPLETIQDKLALNSTPDQQDIQYINRKINNTKNIERKQRLLRQLIISMQIMIIKKHCI